MNSLNSILIEGILEKEPLYRITARGTPVCTFKVVSSGSYREDGELKEEQGCFSIESWRAMADHCNALGHKGSGVRVVGRLKELRWDDRTGKKQSRIIIVGEHVEFRPEQKEEGVKE
jgi:single-strand DNA-binding protein